MVQKWYLSGCICGNVSLKQKSYVIKLSPLLDPWYLITCNNTPNFHKNTGKSHVKDMV